MYHKQSTQFDLLEEVITEKVNDLFDHEVFREYLGTVKYTCCLTQTHLKRCAGRLFHTLIPLTTIEQEWLILFEQELGGFELAPSAKYLPKHNLNIKLQ